ncbi:MAG: hypothetical protein Q4D62_12380 [Planctomycetia bacterium]|nr:hypothetical protein [Planctomycetia bacterium]
MKIYVLNMPKHTERLAGFQSRYPSEMPEFEVVTAKTPDEIEVPTWWKSTPSMASHRHNFIQLFDHCAQGTENHLIFEDDCLFCDDFKAKFDAFLAEVPDDWEMLNLGAELDLQRIYPSVQVTQNVIRPGFSYNTHAILITPQGAAKCRDCLAAEDWPGRHIPDRRLTILYRDATFKIYAPMVNLCGQAEGDSSLTETFSRQES